MELGFPTMNLTDYLVSNNESEEIPTLVQTIRFICIPVWSLLLLVGLFGNAFTVFVLRSKRFRQSSTSFYLTVLAIADILYLLTSMLAYLVNFIFLFPSEMRQYSIFFCVITPFLHYTLAYFSVWLLVAVTVERAIWVIFPFRAKLICSKRNAKIVVMCLGLGFTLTDIHFFFTLMYTEVSPGVFVCKSTPVAGHIFPFYDLMFAALLPCSVMLIANILIGWKLRAMRKFRKALEHGIEVENLPKDDCKELTAEFECPRPFVEKCVAQKSNGKVSRQKSTHLTRMLVSTNVFFIVSVTPLLVYDLVYLVIDLRVWAEIDEEFRGGFIFALERLVYTLWYTNFAIHFLLYCLSGPPFRSETLILFARAKKACCTSACKKLMS